MPHAFRLLHTDDLRVRVEAERLDAAQKEFERHNRVRLATAEILANSVAQLQKMCDSPFAPDPKELRLISGTIDGVLEVLRGEWIASPASRATKGGGR